jgi:hypothetical protein
LVLTEVSKNKALEKRGKSTGYHGYEIFLQIFAPVKLLKNVISSKSEHFYINSLLIKQNDKNICRE